MILDSVKKTKEWICTESHPYVEVFRGDKAEIDVPVDVETLSITMVVLFTGITKLSRLLFIQYPRLEVKSTANTAMFSNVMTGERDLF